MAVVLRVEHLRKEFPGVVAVDNVSFDVNEGEVLALLGENGAGKSTISKMICGILTPDKGSIRLNGKELHLHSPKDAAAEGIAMVHQELSMVGEMTVAENIFMNRQPTNKLGMIKWRKFRKDTRALLKSFNLDIKPDVLVKSVPVGVQQLLEIIRVTSMGCRMIILDEPTSSLTDDQVKLMFDIVNQLKKEGCSFIYITHKLDEVKALSDRIVVMRDGCYVGERKTSETSIDEIITMMVGREITQLFGDERQAHLTDDYVFEVKNLSHEALYEDISFGVKGSEILGIAGLVGAGRTEMALGIVGAHKRSGKIYKNGKEVSIKSPYDAVKNSIAYVTEDRKGLGLYLDYSISKNILVMKLRQLSNKFGMLLRKGIARDAQQQVQDFGIATPSINQKIGNLSGGNQQKCLLAMWVGINPDVFIIDEPTRGIDVGAKAEIYQMLKGLADKGKAVVVISSELTELLGICDRIVVMGCGKIAGEVEKNEFSEKAIMSLAMKFNV